MRAVANNQEDMVKLLIDGTDRRRRTQALARSMSFPDGRIAQILLDSGTATDFEQDDKATLIVEYNGCDFPGPAEDELIPPLIRAISLGHVNLVRLLVAHGANVDVEYHGGIKTLPFRHLGGPLRVALELGNQDIVEFLRDHDADENVGLPDQTFRGWSYIRPTAS